MFSLTFVRQRSLRDNWFSALSLLHCPFLLASATLTWKILQAITPFLLEVVLQDRVDDTGRLLAPGVVMLVVLILVLVSGRTKKEDKNCVKVHLVEGNGQELMVSFEIWWIFNCQENTLLCFRNCHQEEEV